MYIEFHDDLLTHPKVDRLARVLNIPRLYAIGVLGSLWLWTARHADDGNLSKYAPEEIAAGMQWEGDAKILFSKLIETRFLDEATVGLIVHDWPDYGIRILKNSRDRQQKFRQEQHKKNGKNSASAAINASSNSVPQ
jgi:hypothetical protein